MRMKITMKIIPAYLIQDPSDDDKRKLQVLGAIYSVVSGGWFVTQEQKSKIEDSKLDPSVLPTPDVKSKGIGIFIDDLNESWKVHGDTFPKKDTIKQFGARWNSFDKSWHIPKTRIDYDQLVIALQ